MLVGLISTPGCGVEDIVRVFQEKLNFKPIATSGIHCTYDPFKSFEDDTEMLNYVTNNWRDDFLIPDMSVLSNVKLFLKRPFFMLITVDSSLMVKFRRFLKETQNCSLEEFCQISDKAMNDNFKYQDQALLKLINNTTSFENLCEQMLQINLKNPERLRPDWDSYFMHFADLAAERANCMKRKVGCVIVQDKRVVATGYNGTPRGFTNCSDGGCKRCNDSSVGGVGLSTCLCLHAEENALLEAGRSRIHDNSILYCNTCPCLTCSIKIIQVGITEVVYSQSYSMDEFSKKVFKEAGVKLRQFIPPTHGTIILK